MATVHKVTKSRTRLSTHTQGVAPETPHLPQTLWGEAVTSLPRSKGRNVDLNSQCRESRRIMQPFIKTALERVPSQLEIREEFTEEVMFEQELMSLVEKGISGSGSGMCRGSGAKGT